MQSPFAVLEVDPDASESEIERAYRRRIKEAHPDQGGSVGEFLTVRAAYEQLADGEVPPEDFNGQASAPTGSDGAASGGVDGEEPVRTHVEYLNFDVIVDRGWDLADGDVFEKAAGLDLDAADYGEFVVDDDRTLLQAAEDNGAEWPYSCRGGACANCAVAVLEGELSVPVNHILPEDMLERDVRLSCVGEPLTDELRVVYNVKHLPELDELRLPPHPSD